VYNLSWNDEKILVGVLGIFSMFSLLVLSRDIGIIFGLMTLWYALLVFKSGNFIRALPFSKGKLDLLQAATIGGIGASVFLFLSTFINQNMFSTLDILALNKSVFISINEPVVQLIIWGFYIPLVESAFFFGFIFPYVMKGFKTIKFKVENINSWIAIIFIGALVSLFHLAVRVTLGSPELTNLALLTDVMFFSLSGFLALKYMEWKQLGFMHIIINTAVVLLSLGMI